MDLAAAKRAVLAGAMLARATALGRRWAMVRPVVLPLAGRVLCNMLQASVAAGVAGAGRDGCGGTCGVVVAVVVMVVVRQSAPPVMVVKAVVVAVVLPVGEAWRLRRRPGWVVPVRGAGSAPAAAAAEMQRVAAVAGAQAGGFGSLGGEGRAERCKGSGIAFGR